MEGQGMEDINKSEVHLTSAAAFVEGGIQAACDDACSICLEDFSDSDPSTMTNCKHEFHLQCILEWCQRSSQCPMCLQSISLKDPTSQELLEVVERERSYRLTPPRNTTIFHHPTLGDFELQHLPVGGNDAELEERILQHLAAAASMGHAHHISRREGRRNRSSSQGRPQFLVFSTHPNTPSAAPASSYLARSDDGEPVPAITVALPSTPATVEESSQLVTSLPSIPVEPQSASASSSTILAPNQHGSSSINSRASNQPFLPSQEKAGPSDFQSFSESMKSRFNTMSMRYKESISKSTRGWKERLFSHNPAMADLGSEVKREVNAGIATVSRLMERLETRDNNPTNTSISDRTDNAVPAVDNRQISDHGRVNTLGDPGNMHASSAAGSSSN